jgi:hypothetical protein
MAHIASGQCPICDNTASILQIVDDKHYDCDKVTCPRCGHYALASAGDIKTGLRQLDAVQIKHYATEEDPPNSNKMYTFFSAVSKTAYASKAKTDTSESRAVISHALSKGPINRLLTYTDFTNILTHTMLPTPAEQADNLLRYVGDKCIGFGDTFTCTKESDEIKNVGARIGSRIESEWGDFYTLVVALAEQGLLHITWATTTSGGKKNIQDLSLMLSGWNKYEELDRKIRSKTAFIAMKFRTDDGANYYFQDELLPKYLVAAVKQTGFALGNPLAENPQAGNLHARLEVEIKNARFVVAELSHSNNGAYWEAGFAKGLGKPVIYMYNKDIGERPTPHFDVGSDQIIFWEVGKPENAAQSLKDIIQNTLFGEANQNDDSDARR